MVYSLATHSFTSPMASHSSTISSSNIFLQTLKFVFFFQGTFLLFQYVTSYKIAGLCGLDSAMPSLLYSLQCTYNYAVYTPKLHKCRHLKKLTGKGTLRQVFIRLYRLLIQSVISFVNCCPSNLLSGYSPPPPSLCE